jgi:hypothetical protein
VNLYHLGQPVSAKPQYLEPHRSSQANTDHVDDSADETETLDPLETDGIAARVLVPGMLHRRHTNVHSRDVALTRPAGMLTTTLVVEGEGVMVEAEKEDGFSVLSLAEAGMSGSAGVEDCDGDVAICTDAVLIKSVDIVAAGPGV